MNPTNSTDELLGLLMSHYKVTTYQELAKRLGVARNTISGWRSRKATMAVVRKVYELELPISVTHYILGTDKEEDVQTPSSDEPIPSDLQIKFSKLYHIALGTDNFDVLDECLSACREKILAKAKKDF